MFTLVILFQDEIRQVMRRYLNGEISEADSVRTIILLQNEIISVLLNSSHTESAQGCAETVNRKVA